MTHSGIRDDQNINWESFWQSFLSLSGTEMYENGILLLEGHKMHETDKFNDHITVTVHLCGSKSLFLSRRSAKSKEDMLAPIDKYIDSRRRFPSSPTLILKADDPVSSNAFRIIAHEILTSEFKDLCHGTAQFLSYPLQHLQMPALLWIATEDDSRSNGSVTRCYFIDNTYNFIGNRYVMGNIWCAYWIGGKVVFYLQYIQFHWQRICIEDYLMRLQKLSKNGVTVKLILSTGGLWQFHRGVIAHVSEIFSSHHLYEKSLIEAEYRTLDTPMLPQGTRSHTKRCRVIRKAFFWSFKGDSNTITT